MKRIVIFFIVFVASMYLSTKLLGSNDSDSLFIKLLISGLIASVVFWFITVWDDHKDIENQ